MIAPRIAACLIVGDSANDTIARCISSIREGVDEIDVYDTGSDGRAAATLAEIGATGGAPIRVQPGVWRDDFAWAREQSFQMATEDVGWLFWLDADDVVEGAGALRELASSAKQGCDGFAFHYETDHDEDGNPVRVLWRERLVRRDSGYRWRGAVHEVLEPSRPGGGFVPVDPAQVRVVHRPSARTWENHRNLELLRSVEQQGGEASSEPRTFLYLGGELAWRGDFSEAAEYLQRYLDCTGEAWTDNRLEAAERLASCLRATGEPRAALALVERALAVRPDWAPLAIAAQEAALVLGDWAAVEAWALRALELAPPASLSVTVNPTRDRVLPAVRLAQAHLRRRDLGPADASLSSAAGGIRNGAFVARARRRMIEAAGAGDWAVAEQTLREVAARYDEELHAVVRGLATCASR